MDGGCTCVGLETQVQNSHQEVEESDIKSQCQLSRAGHQKRERNHQSQIEDKCAVLQYGACQLLAVLNCPSVLGFFFYIFIFDRQKASIPWSPRQIINIQLIKNTK